MGTNHQLVLAGSRLYAVQDIGDRTPLYYTDDAGITWWATATLLPAGAGRLQADPAHPEKVWAGLVNYGMYFSGDGGASWSEQNTGISSTPSIHSLAASPVGPDVVYAAISDPYAAVFRSNDGGQTWGAACPVLRTPD